MSTGSIDYLGAEQSFSLLAGSARVHALRFTDNEGKPLDIADVTFDGIVTARDGETWGMEISHDTSQQGTLVVVFPALSEGNYAYELRAVDSSGEKRRIVFGSLGVLATALELGRDEDDEAEVLRLEVHIPGRDARRMMLEWHSTTRAAQAAEQAEEAAGQAQAEANRAETEASRAEAEANRAEGAAVGVREELESLMERADSAVSKVEDMEGRLDALDEHIRDSIVPNAVTNTWWIAGKDSHYPVSGEPGKSPYIGTRGTWMVWDDALRAYVDSGLDPKGKPGVSPKVGANGNWLRWNERLEVWEDTGAQAIGRDGLDGTAVRRILVESVSDIPQEGETCHGGVYYYVPNRDELPRAVIAPLEAGRTADDALYIDGVQMPLMGLHAMEPVACAEALAEAITQAEVPGVEAVCEEGRVLLYAQRRTLTVDRRGVGYAVTEIPMLDVEGYRMFAWLEQGGGVAGWVCVGEANDLATSEVYGLMKYATDVPVHDGALVGQNAQGQACVPRADYVSPGAVLPSVAATVASGGCIGFDDEGRMRAQEAGYRRQGSVALSFNGVCEVGCVGLMADGTIGLPWATLYQPGAVRLGSVFQQLNRIPYQQGIGCTSDHQICNNILYGGAIQHKKLAAWLQHGMEWLAGIPDTPYLNNTDFYMGLVTSAQFSQSEEAGLVLEPATVDKLAGVHLARSMSDSRGTAVPLASTVREWSLATHYTKPETDTKFSAIDAKFGNYSTTEQMHAYVGERLQVLQSYVTIANLDSRGFATKTYVDKLDGQNMKASPSVRRIYVLEPEEFESTRGNRDPQALYIKATMK